MPFENNLDAQAAGERLARQPWHFVKGVVALEHLPEASRPEVAFAGRSNVGKSSLINAFTGIGGLARTSNTPGRTQELNYFTPASEAFYLVDMPGYGFAQAPKAKVAQWTRLIRDYLRGRHTLRRVFALVDSRHGIKPADEETMSLMDEAAVSYQVVLTKIDKLKTEEISGILTATASRIARRPAAHPIVLATSAEKHVGLAELRTAVIESIRD